MSTVHQQDLVNAESGVPMRSDISEIHYAQLFFAAGHIAIKMLTFVEQMEIDLKKSVKDSYDANKKNKKQNSDDDDEEKNKEDDLAQITGGNDAEIEQYCQMLQKLTD